jgi:hypothetical protein
MTIDAINVAITSNTTKFVDMMRGATGALGLFGKGAMIAKAKLLPIIAVIAGITAVTAGLGLALFKIGGNLKEAENIIIKGTGASGKALNGLLDDTRAVFAQVPESINEVAQATSTLNTLLGSTGKELQDLTKYTMDFLRVNDLGVDSVDLLGKFLNATNTQASEAHVIMDKMTKASQDNSVAVEDLMNWVIDAGPAFEQLGYSTDRSIALFSRFASAGARPQEVISALGMVMNNFAREGLTNAGEAWEFLLENIEDAEGILNATGIALDSGLGRVAAKVAEDIQAGRFEIEDYVEELQNATGAVSDTAEATRTWQDSLQILKNNIQNEFAPAGMKIVEVVEKIVGWVSKFVLGAIDAIKESEQFQEAFTKLNDIGREVLELFGLLNSDNPEQGFEVGKKAGGEFAQILVEIIDEFILALAWIKENEEGIKSFVRGSISGIKKLYGWFKTYRQVVRDVSGFIVSLKKKFDGFAESAREKIQWVIDKISALNNAIGNIATGTIGSIASKVGLNLSTGGDFIVPAGFPNDSFPINVESGERVQVTPKSQVNNSTDNVTINIQGGGQNPREIADAVMNALARRNKAQMMGANLRF